MINTFKYIFLFLVCCFSTVFYAQQNIISEVISLPDIEAQITGPSEFELLSPRLDVVCARYEVEHFGLLPSNTPEQNALAIADIAKVVSGKNRIILAFPQDKEFIIKIKKGQPLFYFTGTNDLLVEGNGSKLKFQDADEVANDGAYFALDNCQRVVIKDLTLGCDWDYKPQAVVAKKTSYNTATRLAEYTVVSNAVLNNDCKVQFVKSFDWQTQTRTTDAMLPSMGTYRIIPPNKITAVYRSTPSNPKVGEYVHFTIQPNAKYSAIQLSGNDHILIENVKFTGIPFMAVAGRDLLATDHLIIRNCSLVPPKENAYWSALEGFDVKSSWYKFENNTIEYCYDDAMNFEAGLLGYFLGGTLDRDEGLNTYEIIADSLQYYYAKNIIVKGAVMGLADENFRPTGWTSEVESFQFQLNYYDADPAHRCIIRFKDPFPPDAKSNYILYSPQSEQGGYFIRNNTLKNCFHHAIWGGNGNGLIENNTITQSGYPAIMVQMVSRWGKWFKGYYPNNVIIRGNNLIKTNTALRQPASLFVGGGYDTAWDGYFPIDYTVTTNVLIEDNVIEDSSQASLGAWSTKNLIIRNNTIRNPSQYPLRAHSNGNGALFVKKSENVFIINNSAEYNQTSNERGIINEDNTDIEITGNSGF